MNILKTLQERLKVSINTRLIEAEYKRENRTAQSYLLGIAKHSPEKRLDAKTNALINEYARDVFGNENHAPWLQVYTMHRGEFVEGWLPQTYLFSNLIRDWPVHGRLRARTMADRLLLTDAIPILAIRFNNHWITRDGDPIEEQAIAGFLFSERDRVVVKQDRSLSGKGITIVGKADFDIGALPGGDLEIQDFVEPHPALRSLMPDHAATLRIVTVKPPGRQAETRSAILRFGSPGDEFIRTDFGTLVRVEKADGTLCAKGYGEFWVSRSSASPDGTPFKGFKVPYFDEVKSLCQTLHDRAPFSPLVGWDTTIDTENRIRIFEWNLSRVAIRFHEADDGPCFTGLGWTGDRK